MFFKYTCRVFRISFKSQVVASQNTGKANLYGFTAGINAAISNNFTIASTLTYTHGVFNTNPLNPTSVFEKQTNGTYLLVKRNVTNIPLDHIPPAIGKTSFNYQHKKFNTEMVILYNGWKHLSQMNAAGEDNAQYATADGFPAWVIVNWRGNLQVTKAVQVQAGIENILDRNYRYFASGFSAGGRNFFLTLRAIW